MSTSTEKFWVDDPVVLVHNLLIFPLPHMTKNQKLNALTRLAVVISTTLYFMKYEYWFTFLVLSLLGILLLKYAKPEEDFTSEVKKEDFTLVPTYSNPDYHTTTVAPLFAEEWQIYPPAYDLYTNSPPPGVTFQEPLTPQSYPYGQYLTRTNLLPSDEYGTHMLDGSVKQAKEYVNTAFLRHTMAHREELTRLYKKRIARRYRHNTNDTFSPFQGY